MKKIRIGKDISVRWPILTNGQVSPLDGRDLKLFIRSQHNVKEEIPFSTEKNVVKFVFPGITQRYLGTYTLTLWENIGKEGQTAVDCCEAFQLVSSTCQENTDGNDSLNIETISLESSVIEVGTGGGSVNAQSVVINYDNRTDAEEKAKIAKLYADLQAGESPNIFIMRVEPSFMLPSMFEVIKMQVAPPNARLFIGMINSSTNPETSAITDIVTMYYQINDAGEITYDRSRMIFDVLTAKSIIGNKGQAIDRSISQKAFTDNINTLEDDVKGTVRYNKAQSLDGEQQAQARANIGAAAEADLEMVGRTWVIELGWLTGPDMDEPTLGCASTNDELHELFADFDIWKDQIYFYIPAGSLVQDLLIRADELQYDEAGHLASATGYKQFMGISYVQASITSDTRAGDGAGGMILASEWLGFVSVRDEQSLSTEEQAQARTNIGAGAAVVVEELSGPVVELSVAGNHEYVCGEVSSLTVTSVENSAAVSVVRFRSGATPTELTLPATLPVTGWRIPQPDTTYDLYFRGGAATIVGYE